MLQNHFHMELRARQNWASEQPGLVELSLPMAGGLEQDDL